jgi:uncharacterized protein
MDHIFNIHNLQLESLNAFKNNDPQLRMLKKQTLVYKHPLLKQLPRKMPGIYTLTGGRQIGKSTLIKQWMLALLESGISAEAIYYLTGEFIQDHHMMLKVIHNVFENFPKKQLCFLMIDEVTYIKDWDKCIKFLADAGYLESIIVMLSGSDTILLKKAMTRFPGRRGKAAQVNFHLYPLSFKEAVFLKHKMAFSDKICLDQADFTEEEITKLYKAFDEYLIHGGVLTAMNDLVMQGTILDATLSTYAQWIRGDILKAGKQERYLREILSGIIKRYGSQITWHNLASDLSIEHHKTVADYIDLLSGMDALFVQYALIEDKLVAAPKKARKIFFSDPFIYHAINAWVHPIENGYDQQILPTLLNKQKVSLMVEACVSAHVLRHYPTYYIKAEGEVDIAYVKDKAFYPIEIKWITQMRPKDLSQIAKYKNGMIYSKSKHFGEIKGIRTVPLPVALLQFA